MTVQLLPSPGVAGDVAHDAVDSGNPVKVGGHAYTGTPAAVANNDRVDQWYGSRGQAATMLVDANGAALSLGSQYTEDAALGSTGTGTLVVARRDDALSTLTPVEGDAVGLRVGDKGALWAQIADTSGAQIDVATSARQDAQTSIQNDMSDLLFTIDAGIGGILTSVQLLDNAIYAEDAALGATPSGTLLMARRDDALTTLGPVEDDAISLRVNHRGALWTALISDTGAIASTGTAADAATALEALYVNSRPQFWNGTAYDRFRGDITNGLDVDITRNAPLVAGTANIGDVDVASVPADPFGVNADAASATGSISAKLRFIAATGIPITGTVTVGSHAVTNAGTFAVQDAAAEASLSAIAPDMANAATSLLGIHDTKLPAIQAPLELLDDTVATLGTTTYTEATSKGITIGAVRRDVDTTLVGTTNEFGPLQMDANGRLKVEAFSGETLPVSGTVTANAGTGTMAVSLATLPALVAGSAAIGKLAANSGVDIGDMDVTSVIPGTGATNLGKAEDAAAASGDVGVKALATRQAALAARSGADLDYEPLQTDEVGQLKVTAGRTVISTATITRPADTTAYTAGDEISSSTSAPAVVTFANCARVSGWGGTIQSVVIRDSSGYTTPPNFELWLFDSSVTPDNDNSAFTPTDGDTDKVVAVIPMGTGYAGDATVGSTGNRVFYANGVGAAFVCSGGTSLYGRLVTRAAFTPISAETFQIRLMIVPD